MFSSNPALEDNMHHHLSLHARTLNCAFKLVATVAVSVMTHSAFTACNQLIAQCHVTSSLPSHWRDPPSNVLMRSHCNGSGLPLSTLSRQFIRGGREMTAFNVVARSNGGYELSVKRLKVCESVQGYTVYTIDVHTNSSAITN